MGPAWYPTAWCVWYMVHGLFPFSRFYRFERLSLWCTASRCRLYGISFRATIFWSNGHASSKTNPPHHRFDTWFWRNEWPNATTEYGSAIVTTSVFLNTTFLFTSIPHVFSCSSFISKFCICTLPLIDDLSVFLYLYYPTPRLIINMIKWMMHMEEPPHW